MIISSAYLDATQSTLNELQNLKASIQLIQCALLDAVSKRPSLIDDAFAYHLYQLSSASNLDEAESSFRDWFIELADDESHVKDIIGDERWKLIQ